MSLLPMNYVENMLDDYKTNVSAKLNISHLKLNIVPLEPIKK